MLIFIRERKISTKGNRGVFAISNQKRSHNKQANYRKSFKLIMKKKVSTTWNWRVLAIVKQECQCKHGNRMRRRIRRNLSMEVQQVFLSVFACSVLLNKEVLYSGHALDQGYLQGVHISSQSRDLVNAFWWCRYLDNHLSFQILTSQVIEFVLKQTAERAILSQGCLKPVCWLLLKKRFVKLLGKRLRWCEYLNSILSGLWSHHEFYC